MDAGKYYNGSATTEVIADTAASSNAAGTTDIYAVCLGLDGFHGISPPGTGVINSYMPDLTAPGAVKKGEVELVAGVALKNTPEGGPAYRYCHYAQDRRLMRCRLMVNYNFYLTEYCGDFHRRRRTSTGCPNAPRSSSHDTIKSIVWMETRRPGSMAGFVFATMLCITFETAANGEGP